MRNVSVSIEHVGDRCPEPGKGGDGRRAVLEQDGLGEPVLCGEAAVALDVALGQKDDPDVTLE